MAGKNRAYSFLTIKAVNEEERTFEGIASTPAADRVGDVVEPEGCEYKLPIPLLWQHRSGDPVGHVISVNVSKSGISVKCKLAKTDEPGELKEFLDKCWQQLKLKLVQGLSIGFNAIESNRIENTYSYRFVKWEWLELSCVTIPANQEASITSLKSIDQALLAASGRVHRKSIQLQAPMPGVSGSNSTSVPKGMNMTHAEMIAALEAKRAANLARIDALMTKSNTSGLTLDDAETQEFDDLEKEISQIDEDLKRRKRAQELSLKAGTAVGGSGAAPDGSVAAQVAARANAGAGANVNGNIIAVKSNLPPGVPFARMCMAMIRAKGRTMDAVEVARNDPYWMKSTPYLPDVIKTAVNAGDTTTAGWASELVYAQNLVTEFIEYLRPQTILGKFGQNGITDFRHVPFNIRIGGQSAGATAYWVGEGLATPVSKPTTTSTSLAIAKAAALCVITQELARLSTPSAEQMVRDDLANTLIQFLDDAFINPNNGGVTNIAPASMTYGVTPVTPTGTDYAALRTDIQTLMETPFDANLNPAQAVWIMSASTALKLSMMVTTLDQRIFPEMSILGGRLFGLPVIVSQAAQIAGSPQYNDIIVLLHPQQILMADDGQIEVDVSTQASIQMDDAPTNKSKATATGASLVSMFQTNSMAIMATRYINWGKKRSTAAQWISTALYK